MVTDSSLIFHSFVGHTPLLALTGYCRENGLNATIAAKLEAFNPAGSVKDRTACAMLDAAGRSSPYFLSSVNRKGRRATFALLSLVKKLEEVSSKVPDTIK